MSSRSGHSHTNIVITVTKLAEITNKIISIIGMIHTIFELNCLLKYVKGPKFSEPENFAVKVICLKFKQKAQTLGYFIKKMQME